MDAVPYAFCDAVAAQFSNIWRYENKFASSIWNGAFNENIQKRTEMQLSISCIDRVWTYEILKNLQHSLTFQELQDMNPKYLRFSKIRIACETNQNPTSFEEIKEMVKFSLPCVNSTQLNVDTTNAFSQYELGYLLRLYRESSFGNIYSESKKTDQFLITQLQSPVLKNLTIVSSAVSAELNAAVQSFILNGNYEFLHYAVRNPKFDLKFLERLFARPLQKPSTPSILVLLYFSFEFSALKNFKKELLVREERSGFIWKREDGTKITMTESCGHQYHIHFICDVNAKV